MQLKIEIEPIIGKIYQLDDLFFRCESKLNLGMFWFQQLNKDGSDYRGDYSKGRRIIFKRINELKLV
jgi:hypothetical protein